MEFSELVQKDITTPLIELCRLLADEGNADAYVFFSGVVTMLADPSDEEMVLAAVIELSRCAFLGFLFSPEATGRINVILDQSIIISHTMSSSDQN